MCVACYKGFDPLIDRLWSVVVVFNSWIVTDILTWRHLRCYYEISACYLSLEVKRLCRRSVTQLQLMVNLGRYLLFSLPDEFWLVAESYLPCYLSSWINQWMNSGRRCAASRLHASVSLAGDHFKCKCVVCLSSDGMSPMVIHIYGFLVRCWRCVASIVRLHMRCENQRFTYIRVTTSIL